MKNEPYKVCLKPIKNSQVVTYNVKRKNFYSSRVDDGISSSLTKAVNQTLNQNLLEVIFDTHFFPGQDKHFLCKNKIMTFVTFLDCNY